MREKNDSLTNTNSEAPGYRHTVKQKLPKPKLTPKPTPVRREIVYQTQIPKHQDIDIPLSKSYSNPNTHPNSHPYGFRLDTESICNPVFPGTISESSEYASGRQPKA